MAIKKRGYNNDAIESLANELADRPYGEQNRFDTLTKTSITLPAAVLFKLEDLARTHKRTNGGLRSVSAIIRDCIDKSGILNK